MTGFKFWICLPGLLLTLVFGCRSVSSETDDATGGHISTGCAQEVTCSVVPGVVAVPVHWPANNGFLMTPNLRTLIPGETIDRYGGKPYSRFFAPEGTSVSARALPAGGDRQPLRKFLVLKPFVVETGIVAPAFGQPGMGEQYVTPVTLDMLLNHGFLEEVKK